MLQCKHNSSMRKHHPNGANDVMHILLRIRLLHHLFSTCFLSAYTPLKFVSSSLEHEKYIPVPLKYTSRGMPFSNNTPQAPKIHLKCQKYISSANTTPQVPKIHLNPKNTLERKIYILAPPGFSLKAGRSLASIFADTLLPLCKRSQNCFP